MADILFVQIPGENLRSGTDIVSTSGRDVIGVAPGRYVCDSLARAVLMAAHPRFVARSSNGRYWRALPEAGRIPVELGGAKGDGTTDDGPAVRATFAYAAAIGARGAAFGSARYRVELIPPAEQVVPGNPPQLVIPGTGAIHDFGGATFTRLGGGRGLSYHPTNLGTIADYPLAADVIAGSREVTLASAAGLAVGDTVLWQLGEFPYDTAETPNWDFARVEAIAGNVVRLDKPMPQALALGSVTGPNKRLCKLGVLTDHAIRDLTLTGPANEDGVSIYCGQRLTIERVGGRNLGNGTVVLQYCDGATVADCWHDTSNLDQGSFGAAFALAETRNCLLLRPRAKAALCLLKAEAGAEACVVGGHFENTRVDAQGQPLGAQVVVINAVGRAAVTVHDLTVTGFGGYRLTETSNGSPGYEGTVELGGVTRLRHPTAPFSIPLGAITGTLDLTIGGAREVYSFHRLRHWRRRFTLRDGEFVYAYGPAGLLVRARAYASPGVTLGAGQQLTGLYVGRLSDNGTNIADGPGKQLEPGEDVTIHCYGGTLGGPQWTWRHEPLALLCTTAAAAGLDAANEFLEFEGWFAQQADTATALPEEAFRNGGSGRDPLEAVFAAYDLPAVAAGATVTLDLAIPDMSAGDFIDAVRISGGFAPLELRGAEARDGTARLTLANPTATALDRAPADLAIAFFRPLAGT